MGDTGILASSISSEPWAKRLSIPNYPVGDAARYAHVSTGTIRSWQRTRADRAAAVAARESGASLSYLQLIEVAVVAAFREAGLSLQTIRGMRDYVSREFDSRHPFAEREFAKSGNDLLLKYSWGDAPEQRKWLNPKRKGQLAWDAIIGQAIKSFEYERDVAIRWHVGGEKSPVVIDPRVAFGAPNVAGLPTVVFKDRWLTGEPIRDTAEDFDIKVALVRNALQFEGIDPDGAQPNPWLH